MQTSTVLSAGAFNIKLPKWPALGYREYMQLLGKAFVQKNKKTPEELHQVPKGILLIYVSCSRTKNWMNPSLAGANLNATHDIYLVFQGLSLYLDNR